MAVEELLRKLVLFKSNYNEFLFAKFDPNGVLIQ